MTSVAQGTSLQPSQAISDHAVTRVRDAAAIRVRLDEIVYNSLAPVCWVLATLFLIFAAAQAFFLPPQSAWIMTVSGMLSAVALAALPFSASHIGKTAGSGHRGAAGVAGVVLVNCALHLALTGDPNQTTNFMLLVIGAGSFMLRIRWFVGLVLTVIAVWVSIAVSYRFVGLWGHFAIALLTATLIAVGVFVVRRRTLIELEETRLQEQEAARRIRDSEARFRQLAKDRKSVV